MLNLTLLRVQVLGKEDLPSLNETIGEESRRGVMLEPQLVDSFAMVVRGANARSGGADHQLSTHSSGVTNESGLSKVSEAGNKDPVVCTYCKKP